MTDRFGVEVGRIEFDVEEVATVAVLVSKLESLEREHVYLDQIREAGRRVDVAQGEYDYAKNEALEKKKAWDRVAADLQSLIKDGPAKPDAQQRLPFADDEPVSASDAKESEPESETPVPAEILGLDLTDKQKVALAKTGAKTLADLADIANGNWPQYPKGFNSIDGIGPKAVLKIASQLPSTAPVVESKPGHAPSQSVRIQLLTLSAASPNLEVGDEYDATMLDDNTVVIQLPGEDAVSFSPGEYKIVEAVSA